ncbi:hypothetical protein GCM10010176_048460 [Nonomuraea spiralis]|nr:hypothetical protein GCM10010176_048460 [Nonomuraea spiralis]
MVLHGPVIRPTIAQAVRKGITVRFPIRKDGPRGAGRRFGWGARGLGRRLRSGGWGGGRGVSAEVSEGGLLSGEAGSGLAAGFAGRRGAWPVTGPGAGLRPVAGMRHVAGEPRRSACGCLSGNVAED